MPFSSHGSHEIQYTESHASLMGVNKSLHFLSMYFYLILNTFGIEDVHKNLLSKGQLVKAIPFLMIPMNLYLYVPHLSSNFGKIQY
jgi:hypothetical protein